MISWDLVMGHGRDMTGAHECANITNSGSSCAILFPIRAGDGHQTIHGCPKKKQEKPTNPNAMHIKDHINESRK